ncbi:MAG: exopolyphosphatase [Desulfobacterales bacterium]|nr:exopolyphosphatase [Desulfobacterales bacterium]
MRIITRPDFDGVVCAVLLKEALGDAAPVLWAQPGEMQNGNVQTTAGDVVANLPLAAGEVALWFDHHVSNVPQHTHEGLFRIAPSAAGLVYEYFKDRLAPRFQELVDQADKIDSAQLTYDEILHPENYPYVLLSMTIFNRRASDEAYCNLLVELLKTAAMDQVLATPMVRQRCKDAVAANKAYENYLKRNTCMRSQVSITDFRSLTPVPDGNRFLVYSLFPQAVVNVKLFYEGPHVAVKLGHSILNPGCRVNVGQLLAHYGGGGHKGAGACRLAHDRAEAQIEEIIAVLIRNQ